MRDAFTWSFPIGYLFGITIRVHFLLPVLYLGLVWRASDTSKGWPPGAYVDMAVILALMFLSILLHEFGHSFAARRVDGESDEVLLWPLGGLARVDVPHTPWANFITYLGGPLVNLVLCVLTALALAFLVEPAYRPPWNPFELPIRGYDSVGIALTPWSYDPTRALPRVDAWAPVLLARLFWVNWILFLFNMCLIGFPFDAGRMLQCLLWPFFGYKQSMQYAIFAGFGMMLILLVVAFASENNGVLLLLLAWFVYSACKHEWLTLENSGEDSVFGYDFSQGYTSLERDEEPTQAPPQRKKQNFLQRWLQRRAARKRHEEQQRQAEDDRRMDELLEKIQRHGKESLTDEEQRFLKRVSDRYRNKPS